MGHTIGGGENIVITKPVELKQVSNDELSITWDDGHVSVYRWTLLRHACPCAWCESERGANRLVVKASTRPTVIVPMGNYAYGMEWDDGHSTGIYSFDFLRYLCPCGQIDHAEEKAQGRILGPSQKG